MEMSRVSKFFFKRFLTNWSRNSTCLLQAIQSPRHYSTPGPGGVPEVGHAGTDKAKKISQAMKSYLERAQEHNTFMDSEYADYEMGKRHLAHMMGLDPEAITQKDIDEAITYLMPSGLHEKKARPMMKHPDDVIPRRKAVQFGVDGRPFQSMFYTGQPNFYQLMHDISTKIEEVKAYEDKMIKLRRQPDKNKQIILAGSQWIIKEKFEDKIQDKVSDDQFANFTAIMLRLVSYPYSYEHTDFIMSFRRELQTQNILQDVPPLMEAENGRKYMEAEGTRKNSKAKVRVYNKGSGRVTVNNQDLLTAFPRMVDREQLLFPLLLTDLLTDVDIEATVEEGGPSGQAGAIRLAMSIALQSFVDRDTRERMRLAGLLTRDPRKRERKKPGQKGARAKFTWKKR